MLWVEHTIPRNKIQKTTTETIYTKVFTILNLSFTIIHIKFQFSGNHALLHLYINTLSSHFLLIQRLMNGDLMLLLWMTIFPSEYNVKCDHGLPEKKLSNFHHLAFYIYQNFILILHIIISEIPALANEIITWGCGITVNSPWCVWTSMAQYQQQGSILLYSKHHSMEKKCTSEDTQASIHTLHCLLQMYNTDERCYMSMKFTYFSENTILKVNKYFYYLHSEA